MKSTVTATIELTPEDVKEAIKQYIENNFDYGNVDKEKIHLAVGVRSQGMGYSEWDEHYFQKANIQIELEGK